MGRDYVLMLNSVNAKDISVIRDVDPMLGRRFKQWFNINPLSPHDALKHHFTSLKTDYIFLQLRDLEGKFPLN